MVDNGGTIAAFKDTGNSAEGLWGEASKLAATLLFVARVVGMKVNNKSERGKTASENLQRITVDPRTISKQQFVKQAMQEWKGNTNHEHKRGPAKPRRPP